MTDDGVASVRREVEAGETPCRGVTLGESRVDFACFWGETLRSFRSLIFNVEIR